MARRSSRAVGSPCRLCAGRRGRTWTTAVGSPTCKAEPRRFGHALHQEHHAGDLWIVATAAHLGLPPVTRDAVFANGPSLAIRTEV